MSENQNNRDYGQQFKIELEQALGSGDFSGLNRLVNETVKVAVSEAAEHVVKGVQAGLNPDKSEETVTNQRIRERATQRERYAQERLEREREIRERAQRRREERIRQEEQRQERAQQERQQQRAGAWYKKTGNIAATLFQVFGWIGTGVFAIPALLFLILFLVMQSGSFLSLMIVFLFLLAGSVFLLGRGLRLKSQLTRAARYFQLSEKTGYKNISELAEAVSRKEKQVVKDLRDLISKGVFPQGHLDEQEKCFMLNDRTYEEYQTITKERALLEVENQKSAANTLQNGQSSEEQEPLAAVIAEGHEYIKRIRQANDAIPAEPITTKLYRMEDLLKEIFIDLEKMPQQLPKLHKLMNYYLPTTLKLVNAYEEFEHMSVQGKDVTDAKKEIENTIDTINDAFGELLNKLFMDTALDVTTDAQVLKTMLAKEGLTEGGMEYVNEYR